MVSCPCEGCVFVYKGAWPCVACMAIYVTMTVCCKHLPGARRGGGGASQRHRSIFSPELSQAEVDYGALPAQAPRTLIGHFTGSFDTSNCCDELRPKFVLMISCAQLLEFRADRKLDLC